MSIYGLIDPVGCGSNSKRMMGPPPPVPANTKSGGKFLDFEVFLKLSFSSQEFVFDP